MADSVSGVAMTDPASSVAMAEPASGVAKPSIQAGDTIFIPSGGSGEHLFVVVTDIRVFDRKRMILLVPIESLVQKSETSCLLNPGDHAFVKHASHIGYSHCREEDMDHVEACIRTCYYRLNVAPVSSTVLQKIQAGYRLSNRVPRFIKRAWTI